MISILCPTRGRPDNVRRLHDSAMSTAQGAASLEFIFYVDDDDAASYDVVNELGVQAVVGTRIVLSEMWNACWKHATNDIFMQCGDDIIFRSTAWDSEVLAAFDLIPDKIALVHGRDGYQDRNMATHGFLHRNWTDAVGYFVPPYFSSDYNDLWLTEVADAIGRRVYLEDVYTEHMHPVVGKGPLDRTHQERLVRHAQDNVERIYRDKTPERMSDIAKLSAAVRQFSDTLDIPGISE
jgi:hypothetical protein